MNAKKNKALAVTVIGLATLVLTAIGLAQKQPLHHVVTFEAFCEKDLSPSGEPGLESQNDPNWYGVVTITIDGQKYEGTAAWQTVKGYMYTDSFYGCAKATYDFGDLGMVEIWERCKTTFDDVTEIHRKHGYSGIEMIADGTGAFEKAMGVFYFTGHTEFWAEGGVPIRGEALYAGSGIIDGIKLPEE